MALVTDHLVNLRAVLAERYAIGEEIGRGGMAIVYLAHDKKHDRQVAVKVMRPELAAAVGPERFLREIQIAARLQHPLIVPLFESGEAAGQLYYVMPRVEGRSLRARLEEAGQVPLEEALQIARDVALGLSYAHEHGVVHRDIKPENILLSGGHALIADFGVARAIAGGEQVTSSGSVVGTTLYMSPEQASGDLHIDARSDIYALGCVLYEMLSGEPPFTGRSGQTILARKLDEQPRSLRVIRPSIPVTIESTVRRALAPVPADRFVDAAELAQALTRTEDRRRRRPFGRWVAAAAVLALIGGLALWGPWRIPASGSALLPDLNHIAVLYFEDRSPDTSLRHVANGLTEDLIDALSRVAGLRVVSPSGVRPYRDRHVSLDSMARALGVGTLVEGSVARLGNTLRITVRLVDPVSGNQLDERLLERPWGDLFALERDMAQEVSQFLRQRLGREVQLRERRSGTHNTAAWDLVRRADDLREEAGALARLGDRAAAARVAQRADSLFGAAEPLDRQWTDPIVQRGWLCVYQADLPIQIDPVDEERLLKRGLAYANRALDASPADPRALELRGYLQFREWRLRGASASSDTAVVAAERDLRQALTLEPGLARAWNTLSLLYSQRGDFAEAAVTLDKALQADAYLEEAARSTQNLFFASLEQGDSGGAAKWCQTGQAQFPDDIGLWQCRLLLLGWTGATDRAVDQAWSELRAIEDRDTGNQLAVTWAVRRWMVAAVLARAGRADSALSVLRITRATVPDTEMLSEGSLYEAYVFTLLGNQDEAVSKLRLLIGALPQERGYVARTRWFLALHADPRFQALVGGTQDSTPAKGAPPRPTP